jgi:predicted nucleic acid-binding protein
MVRRANINRAERSASESSIAKFIGLISEEFIAVRNMSAPQVAVASQLALDLGHPLKDCLYLALAMELDCDLVTCDARFAEKAKGVWDRVRVLGMTG